jgi:dTDP-4-dehydrorhamnose reductase
MKKILILGGRGLLGEHLCRFLSKYKKKYIVNIFKRNSVNNFNNIKFVNKFLRIGRFDFIINLSAITNVDQCKKNKELSKKVNFDIVKNISKIINKNNLNTHLIQLSTDQIYNNYKNNTEEYFDIINYYAKTKILAENEAKKINSTIIRTNFFGKSYNKKRLSFSDWIYDFLIKKKSIFVASDILFSPIRITTLCKIIYLCILKKKVGTFNIGSKKGFSKYHFSILFAKLLKLDSNLIIKTKLKNLNLIEKRHYDMRMNVKKFENTFKYKLPLLKNEIQKESLVYE